MNSLHHCPACHTDFVGGHLCPARVDNPWLQPWRLGSGLMWLLPADAEIIGRDGRQVFYASPSGLGSVVAIEVLGADLNLDKVEIIEPGEDL